MKTLVVAPHPDDEILGCGGTLLRRKADGAELGWLIVTSMTEQAGWPPDQIRRRDKEIDRVTQGIGFSRVFNLRLPTAHLDGMRVSDLVGLVSAVFKEFEPEEVFVAHCGDAHSDHRVVFDATAACTKWFRHPSVRRVLSYETISETDFGLRSPFTPTCFVDISDFLERKLELMAVYQSEVGTFPFPRSNEAVRALAMSRGATSGFRAAEAFQLLRERQ